MKHETIFAVEHLRQRALPDAPLPMPRQVLERHFDWGGLLRIWSLVRLRGG
ncbi:MAG TPA: hypothetical protein VHZ56_05635 [Devosia sp.]|nr:hypothetical protein [Devosia sp.]